MRRIQINIDGMNRRLQVRFKLLCELFLESIRRGYVINRPYQYNRDQKREEEQQYT